MAQLLEDHFPVAQYNATITTNKNLSVGGTLAVTGAATITGALTVTGAQTFTGAVTPTGGVAAAGGFAVAGRLFHTGGVPAQVTTAGTDATPVTTETYIGEVFIPANVTLTGISIFNGSATGTSGKVCVALANSSGAVVANSATAGTTIVGTDAYQRLPFTATYAAVGPATYYVLSQYNATDTRYNAHTFGDFGAAKKTGETFGTFTTVTAPTTFTTALANIASLY